MIELARRKASGSAVGNVTFEAVPIEAPVAGESAYDVILGMSVLHLVEDVDAVIRTVSRLLRRGGFFFSSTVCVADTKLPLRLLMPILTRLTVAPAVKRFHAKDLLDSMVRAGFNIERSWRPGPGKAVFVVAKKL